MDKKLYQTLVEQFAIYDQEDLKEILSDNESSKEAIAAAKYILSGESIEAKNFQSEIRKHETLIKEKQELPKLQGSKYVQSNTKDTFAQTKKALKEGKTVLYSGTPCQIKGLQLFLSRSKDDRVRSLKQSILWVEVACHGVPTKKSYQEYIKANHIRSIDFRCKRNGWRTSEIMIERMDGSVSYELPSSNSFS